MWMRASLIKPNREVTPGMFSRVRFPLGPPATALCVAESALGADQGQRFAFVVDSNDIVHYRKVAVGRQHGGLRVVKKGISAGEKVVVSGLQRVRDGLKVHPKPYRVGWFGFADMPGQKTETDEQDGEHKQ
jgi:multidrug efflux pump subunit AcrA (membrane-fusion protein)